MAIAACGDDSALPDAGAPDAGLDGGGGAIDAGADAGDAASGMDAGDAGSIELDGGLDAGDAGPPDAGPPELRWFEEITVASGIDLDRVPTGAYGQLPDRMSGGVCPIDVDGRAPIDLFFAIRGGGSRLYVGTGPLTWADQTELRGVDRDHDAVGCLAFDMEGDGDEDLLVTGLGRIDLFENAGGAFIDVSARLRVVLHPLDMYMSAAAGDLDADGDLDLVVGGFLRYDTSRWPVGMTCGYVLCDADITQYPYIPDLLLVRDADGTYVDRAAALAPMMLMPEPALMVSIEQLVEGGTPEIYIGNDIGYRFGDRVLTSSVDGIFGDVAVDRGLATNRRGYGIDTMGWSSADIDGDGLIDHVASSFEGDPTAVFLCETDFCEDRSNVVGTVPLERTFRWGVALADFDLDGDIDLFEATGHYHSDEEVMRIGFHSPRDQRPNLLINRGDGTMRWITAPAPGDALELRRAARGVAIVDLDDDGRIDVVTAPAVGRPMVLRNVRATDGHWLRVRLRGRGLNRAAAAARVTVSAGGRSWVRDRLLGEGFLGNFDPRMHFGLPTSAPVAVNVRWPDGSTTLIVDVDVDAEIEVRQP
jgi:hypothetical protein